MFTIRQALLQDQARIVDLGQNFVLSPYEVDLEFKKYSKNTIPIIIDKQLLLPTITTFVAEIDNKVIGFLSFLKEYELSNYLQQCQPAAPTCASLLFLTVDQAYRNRGIASALLETCFNECIKQGIKILRVGTDYGNHVALSLYQKYHFQVILNYHIYRIYKNQLQSPTYNPHHLQHSSGYADPLSNMIRHRPISWLYDNTLSKYHIENFIEKNVQAQLDAQSICYIQKKLFNKNIGLTIRHDINREQHYQLEGSIWTIYDLVETGNKGEFLSEFLANYLSTLPKFLMAEMWLCGHDYVSQQILTNAGMNLVYGGISLHRTL